MISVIVPVYNAEKYINRCIDSILCQTYEDFELILVNDGSKDSSLAILREYEATDRRIKVIDQPNKGVAGARNTGLKAATGDFLLYVDADDWIEKNAIKIAFEQSNNADIVFFGSDNASNPEKVKTSIKIEREIWDQERQMLEFMKHKRMTGMLWNKLIRRSLTKGISFNEKTGYGEDAEFLWQVLKKSKKMVVTNEILYHHVLEQTSISHLSFSDKKYSAIPMWESICKEVKKDYPQFFKLAKQDLMCAAVYGMYEARSCKYDNKVKIKHMRQIARKNILHFLISKDVSIKFKLYAIAVCVGY